MFNPFIKEQLGQPTPSAPSKPSPTGAQIKAEEPPNSAHPNGIDGEGQNDGASMGNSSLEELQSKKSRNLLDTVDRLRRSGLGSVVHLPQLIVCGDQSSGKSSVLEAITEIPFPRKENLCTRFATEIILRCGPSNSILVKIIPDKQRSKAERKKLEDFKSSIVNFTELPELMDKATKAMGLTDEDGGPTRAFSRDVLSIEIEGPGRPHLTMVDLPGLIYSENKNQTKEDVELIRGLVDDYIKEPRTIIMAVISAKNDYANQIILQKCREVDPKGRRTLGIITKPDFLEPGSDNESSWFDLANNKDIFLELGWHMLKNRSDKEASNSFQKRNDAEAKFFSKGRYRGLSREMLGISMLRVRLSQLLFKHLKTEMPSLRKEVDQKYREVSRDLDRLGEKRSTASEQRRFLMSVSDDFQDIVGAAITGHYEHEFFGDMDPDEPVDHERNMRRLRAVIQHLNSQFATVMRKHGHRSEVTENEDVFEFSFDVQPAAKGELDEGYAQFARLQKQISRVDAVNRVQKIMIRSRALELPGAFNPSLIGQLFRDQSANWRSIAEFHVQQVDEICAKFVHAAIEFCVSRDVSDRLQSHKIDGALTDRVANATAELSRILEDTKQHPITYDPAYTSIIQEMRHKKHAVKMQKAIQQAGRKVLNGQSQETESYLDPATVKMGMAKLIEGEVDNTSAKEALDSQQAYYKREVEYFIATVTKQVVERHLLRSLAAETISPIAVADMSDEEVALVAAEPEEAPRKREFLEGRKQIFKSALTLLK